jgi:hypothetical protein
MRRINDPRNKTLASVYRGAGNSQVKVHGPVKALAQKLELQQNPEKIETPGGAVGQEIASHVIYMLLPDDNYRPEVDDLIDISGTLRGALDGHFVITQYSPPLLGATGRLAHLELKCRYLGPKKPGDTDPEDNSGNVRLGKRRISVG